MLVLFYDNVLVWIVLGFDFDFLEIYVLFFGYVCELWLGFC